MVSADNDSKGIYVSTEQEHDNKFPQRILLTLPHTVVAKEAEITFSMANYWVLSFQIQRLSQVAMKTPETALSFGKQRKPKLLHATHQKTKFLRLLRMDESGHFWIAFKTWFQQSELFTPFCFRKEDQRL